jgi:flagellar biosynthesis anti-sigma factor FlgM
MKIEGISPTVIPNEKLQKKPARRAPEESPAASAAGTVDRVTLSRALEQQPTAPARDEEEIRRAKVAAIREQLASGSYNISGRDVAGKILDAIKE